MKSRGLIAWNLRQLRVARGLSQEQLGVDAEVDRTYVGRLERQLENPTVGTLDRLADALGVQTVDLFVTPKKGQSPPKPLSGGRKPRQT